VAVAQQQHGESLCAGASAPACATAASKNEKAIVMKSERNQQYGIAKRRHASGGVKSAKHAGIDGGM